MDQRKIAQAYGGTELENRVLLLETVLQTMEECIVICDAGGNILYFNPAAEKTFGPLVKSIFNPAPEQWDRDFDMNKGNSDNPLWREEIPLYRALKGETVENVQIWVEDDGLQRKLSVSWKPIQCPTGKVLGTVMTGRDITNLKMHEEQSKYQFTHDSLTGLPNRIMLLECLNSSQCHSAEMNETMSRKKFLENELSQAIHRGELFICYQPKVNTLTKRIIGLEALLRWHHTTKGPVSPAEFIPVAEETGIIVPITDWVLEQVCAQMKLWQHMGVELVPVSVNLSTRCFEQGNLVGKIASILQHAGLDPRYLEIEITESISMHNVEDVLEKLQALKDLGISISMDDFGTGYSSLSYLKKFPIHTIKIDQSFVRNLADDPDDVAIVTAIIAMADSLGLNVLAEGVERAEQMSYLRRLGCNEMQGYLFGRPLPAREVEKWLADKQTLMDC